MNQLTPQISPPVTTPVTTPVPPQVKSACTLPVIASSGAGCPEHFEDALRAGGDAALAAGIFHREEARAGQGRSGAGDRDLIKIILKIFQEFRQTKLRFESLDFGDLFFCELV